jgi:hypothetical protein
MSRVIETYHPTPIEKRDDETYWWWDESYNYYGPYLTFTDAKTACDAYCAWLNKGNKS